ncbi:cobalt-precorrin-6A reductase [Mycolicibacterium fallax]|uniref:Cobalt-precorrin-6A reductase n=1 Tax=Mycolicibacterium fallax TaxID=1793 RepID=A0A1X1R5C5_MYCFA|nr:cobalt-precorrin-6A reductase [Mycolicibacterium fallax]ORU99381.1 cobalt-precorrin-6A reductase [Mycolicibacterium fallax]BBY97688.1 precorrin-6A reductase [Mycolicibacterium fallax]
MRILLLGGTAEARALAARLHPRVEVISSLAGRVPDPALPVGQVRIGGFGGVDGLIGWLRENPVDAVVDATHPYAAGISANAAAAAAGVGLPHLLLARPAWDTGAALTVDSNAEAAAVVAEKAYRRVFLTTGRSGTAAFLGSDAWFLIRAVTPPDRQLLPPNHELLLSRGPYSYDGEAALLREHRIEAMVTKNSGGAMTRAKIDAATDLGIPIVMIDRPGLPAGITTVDTVEDAIAWVQRLV